MDRTLKVELEGMVSKLKMKNKYAANCVFVASTSIQRTYIVLSPSLNFDHFWFGTHINCILVS